MVRKLLIRGLYAGFGAGILAFIVARVLGEPQINKAISLEGYLEKIHHETPGADLVSRHLQSTLGLLTGTMIYGLALGGIFALVFAVAYGRIGTLTARGTAAVIGLLGFIACYVVPNLKYPANPPTVGQPATIGHRTEMYLLMILLSVVAMVVAVALRNQLRVRFGDWNATIMVGVGYIAVIVIAFIVFPGINEVPQAAIPGIARAVTDAGVTFPPVVLWRFRIASLAIQATLWATVSIVFGLLAPKVLEAGAVDLEQPPGTEFVVTESI